MDPFRTPGLAVLPSTASGWRCFGCVVASACYYSAGFPAGCGARTAPQTVPRRREEIHRVAEMDRLHGWQRVGQLAHLETDLALAPLPFPLMQADHEGFVALLPVQSHGLMTLTEHLDFILFHVRNNLLSEKYEKHFYFLHRKQFYSAEFFLFSSLLGYSKRAPGLSPWTPFTHILPFTLWKYFFANLISNLISIQFH